MGKYWYIYILVIIIGGIIGTYLNLNSDLIMALWVFLLMIQSWIDGADITDLKERIKKLENRD